MCRWKCTKQKAQNGKSSIHCKDSDIQFGPLTTSFTCMVASRMKLLTFQLTQSLRLTLLNCSVVLLLLWLNLNKPLVVEEQEGPQVHLTEQDRPLHLITPELLLLLCKALQDKTKESGLERLKLR